MGIQRFGKPDGGVASQRADFQDSVAPVHPGNQVEELSLVGRDIDGVEVGGSVGEEGQGEMFVGVEEGGAYLVVDWGMGVSVASQPATTIACRFERQRRSSGEETEEEGCLNFSKRVWEK